MKRFMTAILALSMLLSSIPTSAAPKTDSPYVVRFSHDVTEKELLSADVVDADFTLAKENAEYLKQLIDAGKILYCSEPELPCEALAETLGIPMSRKAYYLPELLTAYSIYKSGGQYVFEQHYAQFTDIVTKDVKKSGDFGECITVKQFRLDTPSLSAMSFANYAAAYTSFKEDCAFASGVKSSDDPLEGGSLGNQLFSYTMNVYNSTGTLYGYVRGTIYVKQFKYGYLNNTPGFLYALVASVKAYPQPGYRVREYSCSVNAYIDGHTLVDTATLPSGINYSQALSLSGTISNTSYGVGASYTATWSYNPESQIITESSSNPRIVTWTAQTVSPVQGKAYGVTPNALIFVSPGYSGQRGAFITLSCPALTFWGVVNNPNTLTIGGWF